MPFDRTIAHLRYVALVVDARLIVLDICEGMMARELRRMAEVLRTQPATAMKAVNAEIAALGQDLADLPAGAVAKVKAYRKELRAAAAEVDAALAQLTNGEGEDDRPLSGSQASSAAGALPAVAPQASPDGAAAAGHETTAAAGNASQDAPPPKTDAPPAAASVRQGAASSGMHLTDATPAPPAPAARVAPEIIAHRIPEAP